MNEHYFTPAVRGKSGGLRLSARARALAKTLKQQFDRHCVEIVCGTSPSDLMMIASLMAAELSTNFQPDEALDANHPMDVSANAVRRNIEYVQKTSKAVQKNIDHASRRGTDTLIIIGPEVVIDECVHRLNTLYVEEFQELELPNIETETAKNDGNALGPLMGWHIKSVGCTASMITGTPDQLPPPVPPLIEDSITHLITSPSKAREAGARA